MKALAINICVCLGVLFIQASWAGDKCDPGTIRSVIVNPGNKTKYVKCIDTKDIPNFHTKRKISGKISQVQPKNRVE